MALKNLVSVDFTEEDQKAVMAALDAVASRLDFLVTLRPDELRSIFKIGNNYLPFLEKAVSVVNDNPRIVGHFFDIGEFNRDFQAIKRLAPISAKLERMAEAVRNTIAAAGADAMASALDVYSAARAHVDHVPGISASVVELGEFFKKTRRKDAAAERS